MSCLRIPAPTNTLHLYRHLLREASYLPPIARLFANSSVKTRFRHGQALTSKFTGDDRARAEFAHRLAQRGHHDLRRMRAANAGDLSRMTRILNLALGRMGRRRRELLTDLVRKDPLPDSDSVNLAAAAALAARGRAAPVPGTGLSYAPPTSTRPRAPDWLDSWNVDKLHAFAKSQSQLGLANTPRGKIPRLRAFPPSKVPTENVWGVPLVPKLARSKLRKEYKSLADKVLPPLPRGQWELLRDLSRGDAPRSAWPVPSRRPVAKSSPSHDPGAAGSHCAADDWRWDQYATRPIALVDQPRARRNMLLSGEYDPSAVATTGRPIGHHVYTARLWRRLYDRVFRQTSIIEEKPNAQGGGWKVTWGLAQKFIPPVAPACAMEFFDEPLQAGSASQKQCPKRKQPSHKIHDA